jgi:hypothetical protein
MFTEGATVRTLGQMAVKMAQMLGRRCLGTDEVEHQDSIHMKDMG